MSATDNSFAAAGGRDGEAQSGVLRAVIRLLIVIGAGMVAVLSVLVLMIRFRAANPGWPTEVLVTTLTETSLMELLAALGGAGAVFLFEAALLGCAALIAVVALFYLLRRLEPALNADACAQARYLDTLDIRYVDLAIAFSAALSLFLELAMIRWQSSVLEFIAFYKNFSLLACFAGLGLGYALASRSRISLLIVIPLLATQFCFVLLARKAPSAFKAVPFQEQLAMGIGQGSLRQAIFLFLFLSILFLLTALTFLPIGQLCGRLMERRRSLRAYGLNLLGSLAGVLVMLVASFLWTPPLVWFALCFLGLSLFQWHRRASLIVCAVSSVICTVVLAWWPIDTLWNRIYSPYQLLEIGADSTSGLPLVRAAGHYYQRINDLSANNVSPGLIKIRSYYDFPYKVHSSLTDVAVVGSGTGNDVAAALRAGAQRVHAIEIDPAILLVGQQSHPEKPYENSRVSAINDDARSFFRRATHKYDLIVYGLLDSHTLLSHGSSVRLDSFVYTIEGLSEARNRLKPDGMISLSFAVISDALGRKIYLMLQEAFDGRAPVCVEAGYEGTTFLISNDPNWTLPAKLVGSEITDITAKYANPSLQVSVSTDDWPFFYMPQRVYPISYLIMIVQILILSLLLIGNFAAVSPKFSHLSFFFLGVGFMLIETKGITEMGLTFGNTWQVIGIVIAGILCMAFLGNCLVQWLNIRRPHIPYLGLLAALALGWLAARSGGFASTPLGRLETAVMLSLPLLFSGIVFSTLLSTRGDISGIMAMNLLGAIVGGLLEYNSMYFGFQALYLIAMVCYVLAVASELAFRNKGTDGPATQAYMRS